VAQASGQVAQTSGEGYHQGVLHATKEALAKEGDTKCSYMYSFKNRPGGVLLGGETSNIF